MKTWKHFSFMAIIAIIALISATIACDNGNGKDEPDLLVGNLTVNGGGTIPVYRTSDVTASQASTALTNLQTGYNAMTTSTSKEKINPDKVSSILIIDAVDDNDNECVPDGSKYIFKLDYRWDANDMRGMLGYFATSFMP